MFILYRHNLSLKQSGQTLQRNLVRENTGPSQSRCHCEAEGLEKDVVEHGAAICTDVEYSPVKATLSVGEYVTLSLPCA